MTNSDTKGSKTHMARRQAQDAGSRRMRVSDKWLGGCG